MKSTTRTHAHAHTHTVENDAREKRRSDDGDVEKREKKVQALKKHRTKSSKNSSTKRVHTCKCGFICMSYVRTAYAHFPAVGKENAHRADCRMIMQQQCNTCACFVRKTDMKRRDKTVPIA